ncbi:uncharacterized protein BT62DRAFT_669297 [Guyanagaster necrorhizus]|uniref:PX domain-containing protein n=1 Tax=Guyanagaster necrorhizus TaxID=856835 RepID=A0A9P7VZ23_9AGAR|nr:uncharacterized protein BT62DRAFT_669297 [Guyanagaster necrorhizus MCA 3950]KAG7449198.1 hypothetical protein BT62DRAFT_669297 [Guyanagaster necrorhizus MCA 3950]
MALSSSPTPNDTLRPRRPTRSIPPIPLDIGTDTNRPSDVPVESPVNDPPTSANNVTDLSSIRAHYLKKSLIQLQFQEELALLTSSPSSSPLSHLGQPFSPPPKDATPLDLPFLRYMFRQFILTFPFMAAASKDFYSDKLQPFLTAVLSRNLSSTSPFDEENGEEATRMKLLAKLERNLSMFLGAATKLTEPEEVVRLGQAELDRLEELARKRQARNMRKRDIFEVNIISVRTVVDKGRMRSRIHEEFIIRTRRSHHPDHFVSRRYGDFRTLANELRKAHPNEDIRPPPAKDRSTVNVPQSVSPDSPSFPISSVPATPSRLSREKNRLTLRAYLHSLLSSSSVIASSPVLQSFLLSSPTALSPAEFEDARQREEADRVREDGRKRFAKEIANRVDGLREAVKSVKGDVMGKDGLTNVFATIKITPDIRSLPVNYQAVLEWARISLASTVFHQFVASDNSSETFASLKRLHGLMPYFMLKAALKISNPIGMIRSVLDLFLAQPFGGRSLLQRMFSSSLTEETRALEEEIEAVKAKVDDPMMCEKIRLFIYGPREIQDMYKADATKEKLPLLTVVLHSGDEPALMRAQLHRVAKAHRAHGIYMRYRESLDDSDDDDGPMDEDAWLYEDLKVLASLYTRLRDREQLIALIFEGFTADLLKDIITIFYTPLATVYRAASIADSLGDLQSFVNDLIKTVEGVEELSQEDPNRTVQAFIDLVQRHEQSFYQFVHKVHSKGEGLFDSLMRWIELFITVIREGISTSDNLISLEFLLPQSAAERKQIMDEVDKVAVYHYKMKVVYEEKVRRRFAGGQAVQGEGEREEEETRRMVDGVVGEISFGELISGDAEELRAEDSSEDEDSDSDSGETGSGSTDDTETDSGSESGSTEESLPSRPSRMHTISRPEHITSQTVDEGGTVTPTRRLSLSRSLSDIKGVVTGRKRERDDAPPLPPIPKSVAASMKKPLPPSPARSPALSAMPLKASLDSCRSANSSRSSLNSSKQLPRTPGKSSMDSARSIDSPGAFSPKSSTSRTSVSSRSSIDSFALSRTPKQTKTKRKKKRAETIKPPELVYIPNLLPLFKEMMRPHLRTRVKTVKIDANGSRS